MKKLVLTGFLFCCTLLSTAQKQLPSAEVEKCSQHLRMQELMVKDASRYSSMYLQEAPPVSNPDPQHLTGLIYTIPVVFHVLHNNGVENISDAQILDELSILNRDYARLNADADQVAAPFIGMPTNAEIRFVLATVAPNGNCFSGITRTVSTLTNDGSSGQAQVDAIIAGNDVYQGVWAHNKYLNVYICKDIGGAAGYTYLPNGNSVANNVNMFYNGIFVLQDYLGSIGTSSVYTSRTLTHECGHWFNLSHTWGDNNNPGNAASCSEDDHVQDTPNCIGVSTCSLTSNTCDDTNDPNNYSSWATNVVDNVENYMDYSYCSKMFTPDQVTRMRTALVSSVGGRSNIWTTANLNAVGGGPGTSLCAIDFSANQTTMCAGTTVTYTPNTTSGISAYSWSFPGGTPSSSTLQNPVVTYSTAGTYNASLTVTSSANGSTYPKSKTSYIVVNTNTTVALPISEGFVSATFPPAGWTILNTNSSTTWARSSTVGRAPTAGNSVKFDNYNVADATNDELRLPKLDINAYTSAQLVFDVAYAPYDATYFDGLQVLVSTDCGGTFTSVFSKSNTILATASATTGSFTPSAAQWRSETVDLTPYVGNSSVWIAFRNIAGNGNNLYVDNINVTGIAGTPPAPVASFSATGTAICAGQSVTYTSTSTNSPSSYSWSFPGGTPSTSTSASQVVTYSTAGTYNVSLTATNTGGSNSSNQTNYITVNAIPSAPTISAGGPTTFCQGGNVVLTSNAGAITSWSNSATGATATVNSSGSYTATQTVAGCASSASNTVIVTVNPNPTVSFASVPMICVYNSPITLTQGSPAGGTYSGTGVTGNQFNPATAGVGTTTVTYNYTNGNGCSGSAQTGIVVDACASISENDASVVSVYPNPSSGLLTIYANEANVESIKVFNNLGQVVYELSELQTSKQEINLENMASGVYTIRIMTNVGTETVPVIIKK